MSKYVKIALDRNELELIDANNLAVVNPPSSRERIPERTFSVKDLKSEVKIDWNSKYANSISEKEFTSIFENAKDFLKSQNSFQEKYHVISDKDFSLNINLISDSAKAQIFASNMFFEGFIEEANKFTKEFKLLVIQDSKFSETHEIFMGMDFENLRGVIWGSSYMGSIKKLIFTIVSYHMPDFGILPLHASAIQTENDETFVMLGLSGTGKTTLATSPEYKIIGDDELIWSDRGIANIENGSYAKLYKITHELEPELMRIINSDLDPESKKTIVENAFISPDKKIIFDDKSITENSRISYSLSLRGNFANRLQGTHPSAIILLTADAFGLLPAVAKLDLKNAKKWFEIGYTSKTPGTESGVKEPQPTFSRFFGEPFMMRKPETYIELFEKKLKNHNCEVFLINTGWTGENFTNENRIPIDITRKILNSITSGEARDWQYTTNPDLNIQVPIDVDFLTDKYTHPETNWSSLDAYREKLKLIDKLITH